MERTESECRVTLEGATTVVQREMMVAWIRVVEWDGYEIDLKGNSERLESNTG